MAMSRRRMSHHWSSFLLLWSQARSPCHTALLRRSLIALFLLMGMAVAVVVAVQIQRGLQQQYERDLRQWCTERSSMLELEITTNANHIKVFTAFVEEFKKELVKDSTRFQRYLDRTVYARPSAVGVDWTAVVLDKDRAAYESYWNTTIFDHRKNRTSERKPVYYPLTFVSSSLNFLRFTDKQTMAPEDDSWKASLKGEMVITQPLQLGNSLTGFVMAWPTFTRILPDNVTQADRVVSVDGMISAFFSFSPLMEELMDRWVSVQPFSFHVLDVTNPASPAALYIPNEERNISMARGHRKYVRPLKLGDLSRKHEMWCWYKKLPIRTSSVLWGLCIIVVVVLIACVLWVTVRRMEVAEENFEKMQKLKSEAEAADRAKSTFLATMSHELRTPMNGVLGMLNILKDTSLDAQQMEYARTASSCANALITLVNDILDLAKVESGHMDLERTPFDIRSICREVVDVFQEAAKKKSVELATLVAPDVPQVVFGDPVRIRQVFINLVGNSLKFTQEGHVFLRISLAKPGRVPPPPTWAPSSSSLSPRSSGDVPPVWNHGTLSGREAADGSNSWEALMLESEPEGLPSGPFSHAPLALRGDRKEMTKVLLRCSCEDTGVGIPAAVHHRIFNPFMQADSTTTRKYGGTGIGLSICQKLIGMMGSEIKLVSKLGVGTTFYFVLDMDAEVRSDNGGFAVRGGGDEEQRYCAMHLKGCRTLVAAPRLVRRLVLCNALQTLGMQVVVVEDLKTAAEMFFEAVECQGGAVTLDHQLTPKTAGDDDRSLFVPLLPSPAGAPRSPYANSHSSVVLMGSHQGASEDRFWGVGGGGEGEGEGEGDAAVSCLFLDVDDWGPAAVTDFAQKLWGDARARVIAEERLPRLVVTACSFAAGTEEKLRRIPFAFTMGKPVSASGCSAALVKALGQGTEGMCAKQLGRPHEVRVSFKGFHVLVVDDNLVNRKVACKFLERTDITATSVDSAAQAIAALCEGHPFDAVFMDVQMPEMDGIEATRILRAKGVKSTKAGKGRIPIFAMTADVMKDRQEQCTKAGMDGFIPKPLEPEKLYAVLAPFFAP